MSNIFAQELLIEIFLRLDVKALVKCSSVCKTWKSIITDPSFISIHFNQTQKSFDNGNVNVGRRLLLLHVFPQRSKDIYSRNVTASRMKFSLRFDDGQLGLSSNLYPPDIVENDSYLRVVGTCNGLVCLADDLSSFPFNLIVWNPCIRRFVRLPQPSTTSGNHCADIGFGFDSKTSDFKVVRICNGIDSAESTLAEVYSLSSGSWKYVSGTVPHCRLHKKHRSPQALVNGVLHWIQRRRQDGHLFNFILCFHLEDEVFQEIMLPQSLATSDCSYMFLLRFGQSLAVVERCMSPAINVWLIQEYGVADSWGILFSISSEDFSSEDEDSEDDNSGELKVLAIRKSSELIVEFDGEMYSLRKGRIKDLNLKGNGNSFVDYYVESLFLLNNVKYVIPYTLCGDMHEKVKKGNGRLRSSWKNTTIPKFGKD